MSASKTVISKNNPDPSCLRGVSDAHARGVACCASSCRTCGGSDCHLRPGGRGKCCATVVEQLRSCAIAGPPCSMRKYTQKKMATVEAASTAKIAKRSKLRRLVPRLSITTALPTLPTPMPAAPPLHTDTYHSDSTHAHVTVMEGVPKKTLQ